MTTRAWLAAGVLAAAGLGMACASSPTSTNNCGSGTAPSLVGSYSLSKYTFGSTVYTTPAASGTLTFTANTYSQALSLPTAALDTTANDSGTYLIVGSECIYEHTLVAGNRDFGGTLAFTYPQGDTILTLNGNDSLRIIIGVWKKQ
jgi:hypothetical protein